MAIAKTTLHHLFSWCPRSGQTRLDKRERHAQAEMNALPATGSQLTEHIDAVVHRTLSPDLRQCEPWRQATLLDVAARNDPERHKRLTR